MKESFDDKFTKYLISATAIFCVICCVPPSSTGTPFQRAKKMPPTKSSTSAKPAAPPLVDASSCPGVLWFHIFSPANLHFEELQHAMQLSLDPQMLNMIHVFFPFKAGSALATRKKRDKIRLDVHLYTPV